MEGLGKQVKRCVIVGAAPFSDAAYLRRYVLPTDYIIAADGGQRLLEKMGRTPDLIIGDFDSSNQPQTTACQVLPTRKDDTDVMAAVRLALADGYREFVLLGCLGGRLDHTFANVFVLRFLYENGACGMLCDEHHEIMLLASGNHTVDVQDDCFVSLLPYGGNVEGVTLRNAQYPLENACLDTVFPLGVSNGFTDKPMEISLKNGYLLLVLAKEPAKR